MSVKDLIEDRGLSAKANSALPDISPLNLKNGKIEQSFIFIYMGDDRPFRDDQKSPYSSMNRVSTVLLFNQMLHNTHYVPDLMYYVVSHGAAMKSFWSYSSKTASVIIFANKIIRLDVQTF